ncbi:MAG TPA: hypothetical protein PLX49_13495, partial [Prolixibacteraceae bacterium]|nr:hypothetical protein [Prolixibacteraceae bacterium]
MVNLAVDIKGLHLKNPVMTASGCSGFGTELADFYDPSLLGALLLKGITPRHRDGNPYPRMAETASGMLNAVGLQNKGVDYFIGEIYPRIKDYDTALIVNVNGSTVEEYVEVTEKIAGLDRIAAMELNISCPNVKEGGMAFGVSCPGAAAVTRDEALTLDGSLAGTEFFSDAACTKLLSKPAILFGQTTTTLYSKATNFGTQTLTVSAPALKEAT